MSGLVAAHPGAGVESRSKATGFGSRGPRELEKTCPDTIIKYEEGRLLVERPVTINCTGPAQAYPHAAQQHGGGRDQRVSEEPELVGVSYRAPSTGKKLVLAVGYSTGGNWPAGRRLKSGAEQNQRQGVDKEKVGALAAVIRAVHEPEPYGGPSVTRRVYPAQGR